MIRIYLTIIFSALSFVGLHASTVEKTAEMSSFYYLSGFVGGDINIYYQAPLSSATNYPIISNNRIGINYTNANTFVLSANNGAIITNIVMTVTQTTSASYAVDGSSTYKSLTLSNNTFTASSLSANTVTFKCTASSSTKTLIISSLSITYEIDEDTPTVTTPQLDVPDGEYTDELYVRVSNYQDGVSYYYTTDGSDPSTSSAPYSHSDGIRLSYDCILNVIADSAGYISQYTSAEYKIDVPSIVWGASETRQDVSTSTTTTSQNILDFTVAGVSYVDSYALTNYVYKGSNGVRIGSDSQANNSALAINLKDTLYNVTGITLIGRTFETLEKNFSVRINTLVSQKTENLTTFFSHLYIEHDGTTPITRIQISTYTCRAYLKAILFHFKEGAEEVSLAELVESGKADCEYTINNDLHVVAIIDGDDTKTLLLKDEGEAVSKVTMGEEQADYLINANSIFSDDAGSTLNTVHQDDYDQSNWLEVVASNTVAEGIEVDDVIAAKSITGTYTDTLNPRLELTSESLSTTGEKATPYQRNAMCPANFVGSQTGNNGKEYFFMTPKNNELVQVVWAVYEDGSFYCPESANGFNVLGFEGRVDVGSYEYNVTSEPALVNGTGYQFKAIVKAQETSSAAPRKTISTQPTEKTSNYVLYPLNLEHDDEIITNVVGINNSKTVSGVRYYNLQGMQSENPYSGFNIVVTNYSDGTHSVNKVIK